MRSKGTIYSRSPEDKQIHKVKKNEGLNGDSGVGQAPESSSKPLMPQQRSGSHDTPNRFLSRLGTSLIIFSLLGFLLTYGPIIRVEIGYRLTQFIGKNVESKGSFADLLGKTLVGEPEGVPDPNFSLIIPKIHAKGKVIANVDPADESAYMAALKTGIAHAKGTYLPGGKGNIYLFAHSTDSPLNIVRYNAVFYLLRELEPGDGVEVYFSGVKHRYRVTDKKIVEPTDVSYLTPYNQEAKEQLILQTCWPPGTTLKRLLIFADKITL